MILFLDLDSRQILDSRQAPFRALELKRRDTDLIELQFLRDRVVQELPTGTTIRLGLKPAGDYDSDFLATGTFAKSGTGTSTKYLLELNLNTVALNAAFAATTPEPENLAAMAEIEWTSGTNISSSKTLLVTIANDIIRGDEGTPAAIPDLKATQAEAISGSDNSKWVTPLRVVELVKAIFLPVSISHTFSSSNETTPYTVPSGRYRRLTVNSYSPVTQDFSLILPRTTDGAIYGDILRINFGRAGHTKRLLVQQYVPSYPSSYSSTLSTLATLSETGVYSFHCAGLQWESEESFTGLGRNIAPQLLKFTATSTNINEPYVLPTGRETILKLDTNVFESVGTPKVILPRYADGAKFGDVVRIRYMRVGQSAPLDVRAYQWTGTDFSANHSTYISQNATVASYVMDENGWVTESQWLGYVEQ